MRKKIGYALLNNIVTAFFPFILILIVSKRMGVSDFGKLSLWISMVALFAGIADLGFSTSMVSDYNSLGPERTKEVIGKYNHGFFRWLVIFSAMLVIGLIVIRNRYGFSRLDMALLWVSVVISTIYRYLTCQYFGNGNTRRLFVNSLAVAVIRLGSIFALILVLRSHLKPELIFPLYLFGTLVGLTLLLRDQGLYWRATDRKGMEPRHLKKVAWVGLTNAIILGRTRGDLALAQLFFPPAQLAIYSVANVLGSGVNLLTGAVVDNYIPLVGKRSRLESLQMLGRHLILALPAVALLCFLGWVLSPIVVKAVAGSRYQDSIPILRILLIGYVGALAFVPLEAYLYVYLPSRVFLIKLGQLAIFLCAIFVLAPGRSIQVMGYVGLVVSIGGWLLGGLFMVEAWFRVKSEKEMGFR